MPPGAVLRTVTSNSGVAMKSTSCAVDAAVTRGRSATNTPNAYEPCDSSSGRASRPSSGRASRSLDDLGIDVRGQRVEELFPRRVDEVYPVRSHWSCERTAAPGRTLRRDHSGGSVYAEAAAAGP